MFLARGQAGVWSAASSGGDAWPFALSWLGLVLASILILVIQAILWVRFALSGAQRLHDDVFSAVLHASLQWFEKTPAGRIANRFSKDMDAVDKLLPFSVSLFSLLFLEVLF